MITMGKRGISGLRNMRRAFNNATRSANESCQPTPEGALSCFLWLSARRACTLRSALVFAPSTIGPGEVS